MNNMYKREIGTKYILFTILLSVLRFSLVTSLQLNTAKQSLKGVIIEEYAKPRRVIIEEYAKPSLEEFIKKYDNPGLKEIIEEYHNINNNNDGVLDLHFYRCNILGWYFERIFKEVFEEDRKLLNKFERIIIRIIDINIDNNTFKGIVKKIKPTELYIKSHNITNEDIKGIKLNENIEVFMLNGHAITNMNRLFRKENKNLVEVDISCNSLESFPNELWNVSSLKKLDISNNQHIFKYWKNLDNIYIKMYNSFKSFFKKKYEPLESVTTLNMNDIDLGGIDRKKLTNFLRLFRNVTVLEISNSIGLEIISIPLKKLRILNISGNSKLGDIRHTNDNSKLIEQLEEINMHGCGELSIDNEFLKKIKFMKYLNIYGIPLEGDCSEIYSLIGLRVLCIEKDKISCPKIFSRGIKITDDQDSYRKLVEEDREEEKMSLART